MAKPVQILAVLAMLAPTMPATAQFGGSGGSWSPRAAESQCRDALRSRYNVSNTRNVTTSDRGNGRFQVNGNADRSNQTASFNCRVENGGVRNVNVGSWSTKPSGGGDAVAAVGIAVALGALIAAASSKKKSHEYDQYPDGYEGNNNNYSNDSYSPSGGITCYRQQRACFDSYNNYNARWTSREFGY